MAAFSVTKVKGPVGEEEVATERRALCWQQSVSWLRWSYFLAIMIYSFVVDN